MARGKSTRKKAARSKSTSGGSKKSTARKSSQPSKVTDVDAHAEAAGLSMPTPRSVGHPTRPAQVRRNEPPAPVGVPGEHVNRQAEVGRARRRATSAGLAPPAPTYGPEVESDAAEPVAVEVPRSAPKINSK